MVGKTLLYKRETPLTRNEFLFYLFLALCIAAGIWFRFKGLGNWPVAGDEYFILKSVLSIVDDGLPEFLTGGFYTRGLLYQYLSAFLIIIGLDNELAIRLIPAISNLLMIPPLFLIAKKISGNTLAAVIVFFVCFSVWEVEFARFARMYAPFQAIFVWHIYFLYKLLIEQDFKAKKWIYILSFTSIFVFEGSIFLAILNFFPMIYRKKIVILELLISILIFVIAYLILTTDFRNQFGSISSATGIGESAGRFRNPDLLMNTFTIGWKLTFIIPVLSGVYFIFKIIRENKKDYFLIFSAIILIGISLLNLFGLALIFFLIFSLIGWINFAVNRKKILINLFIPVGISLLFYIAYLLLNTSWYGFYDDFIPTSTIAVLKRSATFLIEYPVNYRTFWMYFETLPIFTLFSVFSIIFGSFYLVNTQERNGEKVLFIIFLVMFLLATVISTKLIASRYTFFLYPLFALLAFQSFYYLLTIIIKNIRYRKIAFVLILIPLFLISKDFNLNHLINIDTKKINYRIGFDKRLSGHLYDRWDFKTPAEYVNANSEPDDISIAVHVNFEQYVDDLSYIYMDAATNQFAAEHVVVIDGEFREKWSDVNMLFDNTHLLPILGNANRTVWMLTYAEHISIKGLDKISFYEKYRDNLVFTSLDNRLAVYKIPLAADSIE